MAVDAVPAPQAKRLFVLRQLPIRRHLARRPYSDIPYQPALCTQGKLRVRFWAPQNRSATQKGQEKTFRVAIATRKGFLPFHAAAGCNICTAGYSHSSAGNSLSGRHLTHRYLLCQISRFYGVFILSPLLSFFKWFWVKSENFSTFAFFRIPAPKSGGFYKAPSRQIRANIL